MAGFIACAIGVLVSLALLSTTARSHVVDVSPGGCGELTPATRQRDPLRPYFGRRPAVAFGRLCSSDPRYHSPRERRFIVNVLLRDEQCRPLEGVAVQVDQADSRGQERADCGGRFVTDEHGRFQFTSVRPRHYVDAAFPGRLRPRAIQFRVSSDECNNELLTQFYFTKDKRRPSDPCPAAACHAKNPLLFFSSEKTVDEEGRSVRVNNVTITVHRTCSFPRPQENTVEPPEVEGATLVAPAVTTQPPTPCPNPRPTPWDGIGPFYKPNQPMRLEMCRDDPLWRQTLKVELTVHLRDQNCKPLAGFQVDLWSADAQGVYRDYCRSLMTTNSSGMFTLTTLKPGTLPGRPRHIHYIVHSDRVPGRCYDRFNTQSYWSDLFDNHRLVKECTDVFDGDSIKTGEKCDFIITLRNTNRCN